MWFHQHKFKEIGREFVPRIDERYLSRDFSPGEAQDMAEAVERGESIMIPINNNVDKTVFVFACECGEIKQEEVFGKYL